MKKLFFALIISAGALVLAALPAVAQSPQSDQIIVRGETIFSNPVATEADESQNGNSFLYFDNNFTFVNASAFGHPTEIFSGGTGSDIFGVANVGTAANPIFRLAFMSNVEGGLDLTAAQKFFGDQSGWINGGAETGGTYDVARYLDPNCSTCNGTFQSDLGDGTTVPDGGMTVTLLGTALAGMGLLRRKLRVA